MQCRSSSSGEQWKYLFTFRLKPASHTHTHIYKVASHENSSPCQMNILCALVVWKHGKHKHAISFLSHTHTHTHIPNVWLQTYLWRYWKLDWLNEGCFSGEAKAGWTAPHNESKFLGQVFFCSIWECVESSETLSVRCVLLQLRPSIVIYFLKGIVHPKNEN